MDNIFGGREGGEGESLFFEGEKNKNSFKPKDQMQKTKLA